MHVLFIMEGYSFGPNFPITTTLNDWVDSYLSTGYGTCEVSFIDPAHLWSCEAIDQELFTKEYDCALISHYDGKNVTIQGLERLTQIGKRVGIVWWDSNMLPKYIDVPSPSYKWWEYCKFAPQFFIDVGRGEIEKNVYCIPPPRDNTSFNIENNTEEYDVGFAGWYSKYDRESYINHLKNNGINVVYGGGRGPGLHNLDIKDYAAIIKKSKICLNFNGGHNGMPQRKGRVFEIAACGKFMLSNHPRMLDEWFIEDSEFVSFDTKEDLLYKVKHYLENDELRRTIADNFYQRYNRDYTIAKQWKNIFNIMGVDV